MTDHVTDDELRAMLEARAGAVAPGAAREVLAAARAEIAGPAAADGAGVAFRVRRVEGARRHSRMPWGVAAVAAAAIVAVAVLGGRTALDRPAASQAIARSSPAPAASGPVVSGEAITVEELGNRLRTGELDGKTVIVPGRPFLTQARCLGAGPSDPLHDCMFMQIDGLPDVFISNGDRTAAETQASIDHFGQSAPLVLHGADGGLNLVGWLVADPAAALPPDSAVLARDQVPTDGVVGVLGWLQTDGVVRLTSSRDGVGEQGIDVDIDPSVGRPASGPTRGVFLLIPVPKTNRLSDIIRWEVVGQLSSDTVYVEPPPANLAGPTIPAADVVAAMTDGSLDGQILAIDGELKTVAADCPLDARPCERFYVDGLPGVAITWDSGVLGSGGSPGAAVSPTSGRLLVTPRRGPLDANHGYLELLGILDGALDHPFSVADLANATYNGSVHDPMLVAPVDGWLVDNGPVFCPLIRAGQDPAVICPLGQPFLAPARPDASALPTSPGNVEVSVDLAAAGVGGTPTREAGPFLVRQVLVPTTCDPPTTCRGGLFPKPMVVARYDPATVRVVTFP